MHANSWNFPKDLEKLSTFFSWEAIVGDAARAFEYLTSRPEINAARAGIFGHSEGGVISLEVPSSLPPDLDASKVLFLAGTPGRKLGDILSEQIASLLTDQGADPETRCMFLREDERIQASILSSGHVPEDVPEGLRALYPSHAGSFLKSVLALDLAPLVQAFPGPALVVNGTEDRQVSVVRDADSFAQVFKSRLDGSEIFLPDGVSRNLKTIYGNPTGFEEAIDPHVEDKIISWIRRQFQII